MIVKNEAAVIERCLAPLRDLIDTWVISDTGSTDGTQQLIRTALTGIPGELHEEPWVDFGHNRTLNIQHARAKADYLLTVDADHVIRQEFPLPPLTATSYMLRYEGRTEHRFKHLLRGDIPWRYEGVTHEYPTTGETDHQENLDALVIEDHADGGSRHQKYERDARLLSAELERDPDNVRTVFYLAQTRRDMGDTEDAITLYERRAQMGGWAEEVYYALLQVGVLKAGSGDWPGAMDAFSRAWESRPQRLEACYELASRLRSMRRYRSAHAMARSGLGHKAPDDLLFVQPWVYRWGLLFEFSITAYWVGDLTGSLRACDRLLAMPDLPDTHRRQTITNRAFAAQRLAAMHEPAAESGTGKPTRKRARTR
ncbi:glycosyltransferase [Streptomyces sp. NBC_00887]|uniref:glycosyltransferase n=1 Tax=Streptomyces sp. NBC_00887 TaxID=2975859 RepID=UPI003867FDBA|nr:glycosyltransferase [Streptomyces sp. NBC_00887]